MIRLSSKQQRIVDHKGGALLVVAGPGSGKTRVLTERIRRVLTEEEGYFRVLALTFTNKAANEMKERLAELSDVSERAFIGTLHSFCMEVLSSRGKSVGVDGLPNIFESFNDRKYVLHQAVSDYPHLYAVLRNTGDARKQDQLLWRWLEMIGNAKNRLLVPEMVDDEVERDVYSAYNDGLRASNALDYDDLLFLTYQLFVDRPKIANFYRRQYKYICIDESQDLNEAQYHLLRSLCGDEYKNVMMVGDPKQAIYMWNGAHPKYLDMFVRDFDAETISLTENYRSSAAVVRAAQRISPEYIAEGHYPVEGELKLFIGDTEEDEAEKVADYLDGLFEKGHDDVEGGIGLENCGIIARNRYALKAIEEEIKRRSWPYYKQLSAHDEYESDLLRDFELCLRLTANPSDQIHLQMLKKKWTNAETLVAATGVLKGVVQDIPVGRQALSDAVEIADVDGNLNISQALDIIAESSATMEDAEKELVYNDIDVWRRHWDIYCRNTLGSRSLSSFLGQIALGETQQPRQEGLALLTVHSSKGLEFDVVVLMGMMEGVFPDYRASGSTLDEEKRNFFVAVTRSKRLLAMSYAECKEMPWGDTKAQRPSRYLDIVFPEV